MMPMRRWTPLLTIAITLLSTASAFACPLCKDSVPSSDAQAAGGVPSGFNNTIYLMLKNPKYVGQISFNRREWHKNPDTGRRVYRYRPPDQWEGITSEALRIIDDEGTVSTKDAEVAWLAKNAWSGPADFLYIIDRISFPASDVALVVGHGFGTRVDDGKEPCIETYRSSNVFQRIEGTWKPAMSHISGASCVSRADYDALYDRKQ